MKKQQTTRNLFVKTCSFLLLSIFVFDSCTRDYVVLKTESKIAKLANTIESYGTIISDQLAKLDELNSKGLIHGEEDVFKYYFHDVRIKDTIGKIFIKNANECKRLGYEGYLNQMVSEGILTLMQEQIIKNLKYDYEKLIKNPDMSIEKSNRFFDENISIIKNRKDLKEEEKYAPIIFCSTAKQTIQHYYKINKSNFKDFSLNTRSSCDGFWDTLLCGFVAALIAVIVFLTVFALLEILCSWVVNCSFDITANGTTAPLTPEEAAIIAAAAASIWSGISFFNLCCNWLNSPPQAPSCGCPTGFQPVCPPDYWFDGCNCAHNSVPPTGTHAFYWNDGIYYTPLPGNQCPAPAQFFDTQNCYVGYAGGWQQFIYNNFWYVRPKCQ